MSKSQEHKQKLYNQLNVCEKVRDTIASKGWEEILGPKLQKMIESVVGQKDIDGIYVPGILDRDDIDPQYYLGYRAALMDFNNEVYNHIVGQERIKKSIVAIEEQTEIENSYTKPMEDTRYAGEEKA